MERKIYHRRLVFALAVLASTFKGSFGAEQVLSSKIGPVNESKFESVRDAKDWKNPFLLLQLDGSITIITNGAKRTNVPSDRLQQFLVALPASAWPYGRIVAVAPPSVRSADPNEFGRDEKTLHNTEKLLQEVLRTLSVKSIAWPTG